MENYQIGKYCVIYKICASCKLHLHGSFFDRGISPICKVCSSIVGLANYNYKSDPYEFFMKTMKEYRETILDLTQLTGKNSKVTKIPWTIIHQEEIPLEKAINLVKEHKAHAVSHDKIYINNNNQNKKSKLLRRIIRYKFNNKCYYCNKYGNTIDHVIPTSKGGLEILENMVCSCEKCNKFKGNDKDIATTRELGSLTNKQHISFKLKELKSKNKNLTLDEMIDGTITRKKKWE
jgi:5-methylcytosine-specific restriction endonuclease McrA